MRNRLLFTLVPCLFAATAAYAFASDDYIQYAESLTESVDQFRYVDEYGRPIGGHGYVETRPAPPPPPKRHIERHPAPPPRHYMETRPAPPPPPKHHMDRRPAPAPTYNIEVRPAPPPPPKR